MNGYTGFKYWLAMKQHFTTKSFDVFKNKGRMRCKIETFINRADSNHIEFICSRFEPREFVLYLAANMIYGNDKMLWDSSVAIANYNLFLARRDQIGNVVANDLKTLYNLNVKITDGVSIVRLLTRNQITIETVSIINQYYNLTNQLRQLPVGEMIEPLLLRIDKSKRFINPTAGVEKIIKQKLEEIKNDI
jgi:hypothetical protein